MATAYKICIFGPQGSGKGTQAVRLAELLDIPHISPGEMFRQHMELGTPLGKQIEERMNAGHLVPNEITNSVIKERLMEEDAKNGFILDGYPRNQIQADALDTMTDLTHVLVLDVPEEESIARMKERGRQDDTEDAIRQRLDIYHAETKPLIDRYAAHDIVHYINGVGSIEEVAQRFKELFR